MRDIGLELRTVKCDFEMGLMNVLRDEFCKDEMQESVDGCFSHFKQALRRKMLELRIPKDLIKKVLGRDGLMNFFEVIPYDEIPDAIAYVRIRANEGEFKSAFDKFWSYFLKIWMRKTSRYDDKTVLFLFTSWNLSHLIGADGRLAQDENGNDVLVNRTNNPLERFNRKLKESILPHPTVQVFVQAVKEVLNEYVELMKAIKLKKGRKQEHAPVVLPEIPDDFVVSEKKK